MIWNCRGCCSNWNCTKSVELYKAKRRFFCLVPETIRFNVKKVFKKIVSLFKCTYFNMVTAGKERVTHKDFIYSLSLSLAFVMNLSHQFCDKINRNWFSNVNRCLKNWFWNAFLKKNWQFIYCRNMWGYLKEVKLLIFNIKIL